MKKILALILAMLMVMSLVACGAEGGDDGAVKDEESKKVVIYTALSNVRADPIHESIVKQFPDYEIVFEYMGVSELGAKIANEGAETEVDIILDMGYAYLESLKEYLADHSQWNQDIFQEFMRVEDRKWMPFCMFSGCVAVNLDMLEAKGLPVPQSWEDLCDPMYKGLIEMPNPASSGTGYVFLQMLVDLWGEEAALAYFDELAPNVLTFTSSGSAPVKDLVAQECAIALCMTYQAANQITDGNNLQILSFEGGHPWDTDGAAILAGHDTEAVKAVFSYIYDQCIYDDMALFTEHGFLEGDGTLENFPQDIEYADMSVITLPVKEAILAKWKY